jgi:hypothetical protein
LRRAVRRPDLLDRRRRRRGHALLEADRAPTLAAPIHPWWTNAVVELVTNGSFETGDFTGWNTVENSVFGNWLVTDQATAPLSGFPVPPAADGTFQAMVDQTGQGSHILYQDIVIPRRSR